MNEKTLRLLVENGAVKQISIIGNGTLFHVEALTPSGRHAATTLQGKIKTWKNINSAAKWIHALGIGTAQLQLEQWQPEQKALFINT